MSRVRIGSCYGPTDASIVKAMLAAHDIDAVISGEQHASLLGGLGGGMISLDIWVDAAVAAEASQLLRELRENVPADDEDEDDDEAVSPEARDVHVRVESRRAIGLALLLACCITFGAAHMYVGAWFIGLGLAALEIAAILQLLDEPRHLPLVLVGCIAFDAIGATVRILESRRDHGLPRARVR